MTLIEDHWQHQRQRHCNTNYFKSCNHAFKWSHINPFNFPFCKYCQNDFYISSIATPEAGVINRTRQVYPCCIHFQLTGYHYHKTSYILYQFENVYNRANEQSAIWALYQKLNGYLLQSKAYTKDKTLMESYNWHKPVIEDRWQHQPLVPAAFVSWTAL